MLRKTIASGKFPDLNNFTINWKWFMDQALSHVLSRESESGSESERERESESESGSGSESIRKKTNCYNL